MFPVTNKENVCKFVGYTDSCSCADADDRKSTSRYVFLLGARVVWISRKEGMVALSLYEADYIAISLCACQVIWLVNLIDEIETS